MKQERTIISGMLVLQLILWLGFLVHRSPRFPGSFMGGVLAVLAALLMVVPPLVYSATKRIEPFKKLVTKKISLGKLLNWHIYTGIAGSILAILHTGHRFESNLGIWLTAVMLLTVLSGFIGRYFLSYSSQELREKQDQLNLLATQYNQIVGGLEQKAEPEITYAASYGFMRRAINSFVGIENFSRDAEIPPSVRTIRLAESIADLEYAIKTHEFLKRRTRQWLTVHIAASIAFYLLLLIHIWSAIYFGLRYLK